MPTRRIRADSGTIDDLRARAALMLDAFNRAEPSTSWNRFREVVATAKSVSTLRAIIQELRGASAGLLPTDRAALRKELLERFGPDEEFERDRQLVQKIKQRGKIQSEREYRILQSFADTIAADDPTEYLALGALLDEFMSRGAAT
jgi:hypothetical protein